MRKFNLQIGIRILSVLIFILSIFFCVYLYQQGLLNNSDLLRNYIHGFGIWGPIVFILIQISQAVFPIIPGGLGCLAGVLLFGEWMGFVYNYIGICAGSFAAFLIGRSCGRPLIEKFFSSKSIERFDKYLSDEKKFTKLFACLVFIPGAPDDLLCYLAATTKMSLKTFSLIILLGKIPSISLYSLGIYYVFEKSIFV